MKVSGTYSFKVGRQKLWDTLLDTDVLAACIPGCQAFKPIGDDRYEVSLKVGLGAISGSYKAVVEVADKDEPNSYTMRVQGKGSGTTIKGEGAITLVETESGSQARFEGDARVTGIIARVGQRLMGGASKTMVDQFFGCIKAKAEA
jgi:hypothetical protein